MITNIVFSAILEYKNSHYMLIFYVYDHFLKNTPYFRIQNVSSGYKKAPQKCEVFAISTTQIQKNFI